MGGPFSIKKRMSMIKRMTLFLLFLAALFGWTAGAAAENTYPPLPSGSFYAEDYAGILDADTKRQINGMGRALESRTKAQVAAVIVPSVPDGDIDAYATGLFRERGFGDRQMNNGILLLVSVNDRRVRIEVGYGLEGALNDAKAGRILDTYLMPEFQKGNYSAGVLAAYTALIKVCMEEYQVDSLKVSGSETLETGDSGITLSPIELVLLGAGLLVLIIFDQLFLGGILTQTLIQILFLALMRGGRGGGFGSRGSGGSSGGGGAGRRW